MKKYVPAENYYMNAESWMEKVALLNISRVDGIFGLVVVVVEPTVVAMAGAAAFSLLFLAFLWFLMVRLTLARGKVALEKY